MKKIYRIVIIILLLLFSTYNVKAESYEFKIFGDSTKYEYGNVIDFKLYLDSISPFIDNISYFQIDIDYDLDDFEYLSQVDDLKPIDGWDISNYYFKKDDGYGHIHFDISSNIKKYSNKESKYKIIDDLFVSNLKFKVISKEEKYSFIELNENEIELKLNEFEKELFLTSLKIDGYDLFPSFNSNTKNYTLINTNESDVLNVDAKCNLDNCVIKGIGEINSNVDSFNIDLYYNDKLRETYKIKIERPNLVFSKIELLDKNNKVIYNDYIDYLENYSYFVPNNSKKITYKIICEKNEDEKCNYESNELVFDFTNPVIDNDFSHIHECKSIDDLNICVYKNVSNYNKIFLYLKSELEVIYPWIFVIIIDIILIIVIVKSIKKINVLKEGGK